MDELREERLDALVEFVADQTHLVQRPPGGVVELTVLLALARAERAGIAAAHRDHDVGRLHDLVRERLREVLRDVDPEPA